MSTATQESNPPGTARFPALEMFALYSLSGILFGGTFVFSSLAFVQFLSLCPAIVASTHPRYRTVSWPHAFLATFGFYFHPILSVTLPFAKFSVIAGSLVPFFVFVFMVPAFLLLRAIRRKVEIPLVLLWPPLWMLAEWGWCYHSLGGMSFGFAAYPLATYLPLIQIADLVGVFGVSGMLAASAAALAELILAGRSEWSTRRVWVSLGSVTLLVGAVTAYGWFQLRPQEFAEGPKLALVQPNLPHDEMRASQIHALQLGFALEHAPRGEVDLVAFPENALVDVLHDDHYFDDFREAAGKLGAPFLVGAFGLPPGVTKEPTKEVQERYGITNSAFLLSENAEILGRYDKIHLLPFSEFLPFEEFLSNYAPALLDVEKTILRMVIGFEPHGTPGKGIQLIHLPLRDGGTAELWTPICFETSNGRLAREAVSEGAEYFLNITSEGKLGPQIFRSMLDISTFRAVENRVSVARATNTGITAFIRPDGSVGPVLTGLEGRLWDDAGVLVGSMHSDPRRGTFYTRHGDWIVALSAVAASLYLLLAAWAAVRNRSRSAPASE